MSVSPADGVTEGKKVVLTCQSDANPPVYEYSWFDWNNQSLHRYDQMLRLDPVKVQHSGTYRCRGTNRLGVGTSPPSTLTVYCKAPSLSSLALATPAASPQGCAFQTTSPLLPSPLPALSQGQPGLCTQLTCLPSFLLHLS